MNRANYLIFDLDGTLIDSVPDLTLSLNLLRSELGCAALTEQQVGSMVGDGVTVLVQRAIGSDLFHPDHLTRFMELYDEHLLDHTCCYPGIKELLKRHPADRLAIVTNKPHAFTIRILEGLNLSKHFKAVIGGDSYPKKKPDPFPVIKALEQLEAKPDQAVMIGDHHTDLYSGRGAGTATCFCAYGFGHDGGLPCDFYAAQATDLLCHFPGQSLD